MSDLPAVHVVVVVVDLAGRRLNPAPLLDVGPAKADPLLTAEEAAAARDLALTVIRRIRAANRGTGQSILPKAKAVVAELREQVADVILNSRSGG